VTETRIFQSIVWLAINWKIPVRLPLKA